MSAVTLQPGEYWIGRPQTLFPDWVPNTAATYTLGETTYFAFNYGGVHIAAIPYEAISDMTLDVSAVIEFNKPTLFFEVDGTGSIDGVALSSTSFPEPELVVEPVAEIVEAPVETVQVEEVPVIEKPVRVKRKGK